MSKQVSLIFVIVLSLFLASCGSQQEAPTTEATDTPDVEAIKVAMATEVVATITAEAAQTMAAHPQEPSATTPPVATDTATPIPTDTPSPLPTATPTPKPTRTSTPTATAMPGIGKQVKCGDLWQIGAIAPPDFSGIVTEDIPKGAYALVRFMLTNLQTETAGLASESLRLIGELNGQELSFDATFLDTSILQKQGGIAPWFDDFPPLVEAKAQAVFDVNPAATNWKLRLEAGGLLSGCEVEIALYNTAAPQAPAPDDSTTNPSGVTARAAKNAINLRKGPGTGYPVAGQAQVGQSLNATGRTDDGKWLEVCCVNGQEVWVSVSVVAVTGDVTQVPVAQNIPTPPPAPPTAVPKPTPKPLAYDTGVGSPEVRVGNWGLRLYDVKKAKTVYFFDHGDVAAGTWLIPMVEFRNHGTGTDSPNYNIDLYLQDAAGRTYRFDEFNDAVLGAAWQFQAGHLYDDINPGIMIGIAVPVDVPPDQGDMWLRVKQDPSVSFYLGNVSQLPAIN